MQEDEFFIKNCVGDHLGELFDDIPGFTYFVKDKDLRYVAYNKRLQEIFRVENYQEILGKRDDDFFPTDLIEDIRKDDIHILTTGESVVNKVELVPRASSLSGVDWASTTKKPLYNQQGQICGIVGVTRPLEQEKTPQKECEELRVAVSYIQKNFTNGVSVEYLAKISNQSPSTFLRKFKRCFKMSPKRYIRTLKVQDACHKLVQTSLTLAEVGHVCGFSDQSHFSREFSRVMKETPSAYRRRY